ncbi:MAG: hypothetical protein ACREWG_02410, partial [Gammaproteobacteria bacterium]
GCLLVPLPNIETRRRFLKYHDLHHLVTGYSVGRIGEGEVSAWELGSGSFLVSPLLGVMNLIALSTGLVLEPRRMWRAFWRGCLSRNLYPAAVRGEVDGGRWPAVSLLRAEVLELRPDPDAAAVRAVEFGVYASLAMVIHAGLAIPAVIVRLVTDLMLGYNFFQAVKPTKRTDLF